MKAASSGTDAPRIIAVRHGHTEWSENGRHTSATELPLLEEGLLGARALADTLSPERFSRALTSPRMRARQTAELAGFPTSQTETCDDLREWEYGEYEGLTTPQIRQHHNPDWSIWSHGAPGGETPSQVAERADRVIERATQAEGDVIIFGHGHMLRVIAARWLSLGPEFGSMLTLDPATVSRLGYERGRRTIETWNAATA